MVEKFDTGQQPPTRFHRNGSPIAV